MVKASEHEFQKNIVKHLKSNGYITICSDMMIALKFIGNNQHNRIRFINYAKSQGYTKGQFDIIATKGERVLFLELKVATGKLTPEQEYFQSTVKNSYVIRNIEDLYKIIMF